MLYIRVRTSLDALCSLFMHSVNKLHVICQTLGYAMSETWLLFSISWLKACQQLSYLHIYIYIYIGI